VADVLEMNISRVHVVQGDTDRVATGSGTGGSGSAPVGGVACRRAAEGIIDKAQPIAAELLETAVANVRFSNGGFEIPGTDQRVELAAVADAAQELDRFIKEEEPGLSTASAFNPEAQSFPNGCHICEVEIDRETGRIKIVRYTAVDDFGTVVNPLLLAGQVHGGIAQGIGQALLEDCLYEDQNGQLLSGSLLDYCLPRADDLPFIDLERIDGIPCTTNPLGIKGVGETGAIAAPPAVVNAVIGALSEVGVTHIDMPATSEKVWRAIHGTI
ncbi:MAG: xanthine dehydrogenase family protein molybdopterin-binding subunit, partial [Woeseiaceae bacterium]